MALAALAGAPLDCVGVLHVRPKRWVVLLRLSVV